MDDNFSRFADQKKITDSWVRLIDTIAHDFKTPLVTMKATTQAIESVFPDLVNAYKLAVEHKLIEPMNNEGKLQFVQNQALPSIKSTIEDLFASNKSMLTYVHALAGPDLSELSAKACVDQAVQAYPFQAAERELVAVDIKDDFKFKGVKIFIDDLLSNLLSNALRAIAAAQKGEIRIWTSADAQYNELHFQDTGSGVDLKHSDIFDRYSSKREHEVKAGLGFCRLGLLLAHADISCESVLGESTHFVLRFPK